MVIKRRDISRFSILTPSISFGGNTTQRQKRASSKRLSGDEAYFSKKRQLTMREISRLDETIVVIANFPYGIVLIRSNSHFPHLKIRKLLDRIGILGIGSDSAIDIMHTLLEDRIDALLEPGYTRADIWGSELGTFLSRVLGEFFFRKEDKRSSAPSLIFPACTFLFECGHPVYGNLVEFILFDGQVQTPLPPVTVFTTLNLSKPKDLINEISSIVPEIADSMSETSVIGINEFILRFVGKAAKTIMKFQDVSGIFEAVFLDATAAMNKDYKQVWKVINISEAIAIAEKDLNSSSSQPQSQVKLQPQSQPQQDQTPSQSSQTPPKDQ
jgi:hypothetical protein